MDYKFRWFPDQKACFVRYQGNWNTDAFIAADTEIYRATQAEDVRFLFDARDIQLKVDTGQVRAYVEWLDGMDLSRTHPGQRAALVVSGPFETAIAMLIENWTGEAQPFEICSTPEAACKELGVSLDLLDQVRDLIPR